MSVSKVIDQHCLPLCRLYSSHESEQHGRCPYTVLAWCQVLHWCFRIWTVGAFAGDLSSITGDTLHHLTAVLLSECYLATSCIHNICEQILHFVYQARLAAYLSLYLHSDTVVFQILFFWEDCLMNVTRNAFSTYKLVCPRHKQLEDQTRLGLNRPWLIREKFNANAKLDAHLNDLHSGVEEMKTVSCLPLE